MSFAPVQEGCGKWLTAKATKGHKIRKPSSKKDKAKTIKQTTDSGPSLNYSKRPFSVWPPCLQTNKRWCPAKQSKINKFLVNKTKYPNGNLHVKSPIKPKSSNISSNNLPLKRGASVALDEYEELWGSEDDSENENENCEYEVPKLQTSKTPTSMSMKRSASKEITDSNCEKYQDEDAQFPLSKKLKTRFHVDNFNNMAYEFQALHGCHEMEFTQWLHGQVEEYYNRHSKCEQVYNKADMAKEILASVKLNTVDLPQNMSNSPKEASTILSQFSEWLNQQIETTSPTDRKDEQNVTQNLKISSPKTATHKFAFSQWFDETMETFLKSRQENSE